MDWNRLIGMLTRKFLKTAVDKGVKYAAGKGKPEAEMTPEERDQARRAKDLANKAQEVAKVTRRLWR
ncbi:MAG: hypothetical protein Q8M59_10520 [Tabrizicola sp.]|uniref:hypothetical protein n=1 Tax=Tabrizicola sp. TaxID=2005166 RepID=UPI0027351E98|nr:hypothetical protein [Tabrizicola sp.]MDP3263386.1 hypothetical protein [Tabrizicola sp.]MDP3646743.1 hypothetical protein [Paracoccaceae bacterium]